MRFRYQPKTGRQRIDDAGGIRREACRDDANHVKEWRRGAFPVSPMAWRSSESRPWDRMITRCRIQYAMAAMNRTRP
jgi:hypothetical protein